MFATYRRSVPNPTEYRFVEISTDALAREDFLYTEWSAECMFNTADVVYFTADLKVSLLVSYPEQRTFTPATFFWNTPYQQ